MGGLFHAPIIHDRQSMFSMGAQTVTSAEGWKNLDGATITTKDIGGCANYHTLMPILISATNNNTTALFRVLIDGQPAGDARPIILKIKELDLGYTLTSDLNNEEIPAGTTVQVQFSTNVGTVTITEFSMMIDGIPCERVAE